ncbi:MAG: ABC transporter substrate-binding protein [Ancalomicrobiaceae bacterium]|nr:ABC transporter substrate-binding protein [Ancalomicrobiaceae bacterium]
MKLAFAAMAAGAAFGLCAAGPAQASPQKPVIALSNAYFGNSWRHQMVGSFEEAAKAAKAANKIADYIVMNGDGSVAQQSSQIGELILKGVDVLLVDAASETAVNGVIEKACKAGIIVISFDSIASAPCNYQLNFDFKGYKSLQAEAMFKLLGYKGNIVQVRGVKGSAPDNDMYNAQKSVIDKYPDIKVVATVYGQCTASVAQSAIANVLPSLPHVDAVLGQGCPDDVGIMQAFVQYGGEYVGHMPRIEGGGSSEFVRWWAAETKKNGYQTVSMNTTPGIGGAAFWLGLGLLQGEKAPKIMIMPVATVDDKNLDQYGSLPAGQIISPTYTPEWVKEHLLSK